jgi:4-amino-4-deoxy-L-arabinose transferase-like glycosyltransferase
MRQWFWRILLAVGVLALAGWLWTVFFPSPERVIRKRLTELAKVATVNGNEAPLAVLLNSQKLGGFFTADTEIALDVPGRSQQVLNGRDNLVQASVQFRPAVGNLQVEFYDIVVTMASDKTTAEASLTLVARVAGERDKIVQELKFKLNKAEGSWRIYRLETVKTLSRL